MRKTVLVAALTAATMLSTSAWACALHGNAPKNLDAAMQKMHHAMMMEYTGDPDVDFTRGMVPHHQGAVDMAKVVLRDGKDPEVRKLAQWIITTQEQEIAMMQQWLRRQNQLGKKASAVQPYNPKATEEFKAQMEAMHHDMKIKNTGNADVDFVRGMIPHHQGAVDMAITLKRYGRSRELQALADDIIRSQRQEIRQMQRWLEQQDKK